MAPGTYDAIDLQILQLLQEDSSCPVNRIAENVGLSTNACWRRVKRLDEEGFIRKRVAVLDAEKFGLCTTVFMSIRTAEHSEEWLERFANAVCEFPEVTEFYRLSGDADYLVKLQVADIAAYDRVYKKLIGSVNLSDVSSAFAMEELKLTTALPLPLPSDSLTFSQGNAR